MFAWAEAARPALAFVAFVGLHVPSLGAVGLRGPALAFRGLLWACVGLCWPSLGAVGFRGPALACVGLRWPSSGAVGFRGPVLACVDLRWSSLGAVGLRWPSVGCWGPVLAFVGRRRVLWAFVGLCWPSVGFCGCCPSRRGVSWVWQPASNKDFIKRPPQLAVHVMGWACSCIKLSSSSVRKTIKK